MSSFVDLAVAPSPFGAGHVLITTRTSTSARHTTRCVGPPGVRVHEDEPADALDCWRCATWMRPSAMRAGTPPDAVETLTLVGLVSLLPHEHHDWVRMQVDGQLRLIAAFGALDENGKLQRVYRRRSEDAARRLRNERDEAFSQRN